MKRSKASNLNPSDFKRYLNLARLARCLGSEKDQNILAQTIRSPDFHDQLDQVLGLIQNHLQNQGRFHGQKTPIYM
jgi:hypothetical protein